MWVKMTSDGHFCYSFYCTHLNSSNPLIFFVSVFPMQVWQKKGLVLDWYNQHTIFRIVLKIIFGSKWPEGRMKVKPFQFNHSRARRRELTHAVERSKCALIRSTQTCISGHMQILSYVWSLVLKWKNSHKNCQIARLVKYPSKHSRLNVQYQCIVSNNSLKVTAL